MSPRLSLVLSGQSRLAVHGGRGGADYHRLAVHSTCPSPAYRFCPTATPAHRSSAAAKRHSGPARRPSNVLVRLNAKRRTGPDPRLRRRGQVQPVGINDPSRTGSARCRRGVQVKPGGDAVHRSSLPASAAAAEQTFVSPRCMLFTGVPVQLDGDALLGVQVQLGDDPAYRSSLKEARRTCLARQLHGVKVRPGGDAACRFIAAQRTYRFSLADVQIQLGAPRLLLSVSRRRGRPPPAVGREPGRAS